MLRRLVLLAAALGAARAATADDCGEGSRFNAVTQKCVIADPAIISKVCWLMNRMSRRKKNKEEDDVRRRPRGKRTRQERKAEEDDKRHEENNDVVISVGAQT